MKPIACLLFLGFAAVCGGQNQEPKPQNATAAVVRAFDTHNIVMLGVMHSCKQEYEWLRELVTTPEFADRVDDIVMEAGNSLYQKSVDRYIAGENIPFAQVQQAWLNLVSLFGPPSPVIESFYKAVRDANLKRRGKHQIRVVLSDPYIDWETIKNREEWGPFVGNREPWYARVVKEEVLEKKRRALLIMGRGHFVREKGPGSIELELRAAGASTYFIVFGTNVTGGYDDLDKRFDAWPLPAIVDLRSNWVGDLPARPVLSGGTDPATPFKLGDAADALLYVAPRDALTVLSMTRAELEGTAYGKELDRRMMIMVGRKASLSDTSESPFALRRSGGTRPWQNTLDQLGISISDPLPARPPAR
jgi:hypothetical protein